MTIEWRLAQGESAMEHRHFVLLDGKSVECSTAKEKFNILADRWKEHLVVHRKVDYNHAAFMGILGMGPEAIPFLHREVEWHQIWLYAITLINGSYAQGPVERMRSDRDKWRKRYRRMRATSQKRSQFRPNISRVFLKSA